MQCLSECQYQVQTVTYRAIVPGNDGMLMTCVVEMQ